MKKTKLVFWDFDGTMCATPLPDPGKSLWARHHNRPWPHQGWWGRVESMDTDVFTILPREHVHAQYKEIGCEGCKHFVLTSRLPKFKDTIQKILDANGIHMDGVMTQIGGITKGVRILETVQRFIDDGYEVTDVIFFDDRMKEINSVEAMRADITSHGCTLTTHKIESDATD